MINKRNKVLGILGDHDHESDLQIQGLFLGEFKCTRCGEMVRWVPESFSPVDNSSSAVYTLTKTPRFCTGVKS